MFNPEPLTVKPALSQEQLVMRPRLGPPASARTLATGPATVCSPHLINLPPSRTTCDRVQTTLLARIDLRRVPLARLPTHARDQPGHQRSRPHGLRVALGQATLHMAANYTHLAAEHVHERVDKLPTIGPTSPTVASLDEARAKKGKNGKEAKRRADTKRAVSADS
jgi:hypothetical protein